MTYIPKNVKNVITINFLEFHTVAHVESVFINLIIIVFGLKLVLDIVIKDHSIFFASI
jgi:hypothetical protein